MHVTAQGHLETLYKVVGSFQAYATRPQGGVGGCECDLASRLSGVGQELQISLIHSELSFNHLAIQK